MAQYINGPWINLTSLLVGVIGIVVGAAVSAFFYYRSIRIPIPAYVDAWRTRIVDKSTSATPGLQVLHNGAPIVGQDVTSATFYFWNAGRAPIRKADILRPYAFYLGEDGTLLHANVLRATRQECGISISFPEPPSHKVDFNFDVLEYRDGAAVQIIFTGVPETPISLAGVCVGAETIKDATTEYRNNQFNYDIWKKGTFVGLGMFVMALVAIIALVREGSFIGAVPVLFIGALGLWGFVASFRIKAGSYNSSLQRLIETDAQQRRKKKKKK